MLRVIGAGIRTAIFVHFIQKIKWPVTEARDT
jgi:hypothetical protein